MELFAKTPQKHRMNITADFDDFGSGGGTNIQYWIFAKSF